MTATLVFIRFLKEKCTIDEYLFFKNVLLHNNGNKYFSRRKLYSSTFVEDYLSRNNRALNNFMTRLFVLAPNLANLARMNPRFKMIRDAWIDEHKGKTYKVSVTPFRGEKQIIEARVHWKSHRAIGMYIMYYRRLWNKFLREHIDDSEKKINSPFKKGEKYNFKWKWE